MKTKASWEAERLGLPVGSKLRDKYPGDLRVETALVRRWEKVVQIKVTSMREQLFDQARSALGKENQDRRRRGQRPLRRLAFRHYRALEVAIDQATAKEAARELSPGCPVRIAVLENPDFMTDREVLAQLRVWLAVLKNPHTKEALLSTA